MERILEKALLIAINAHLGQKDKSGSPYILHPLRVMNAVDPTDAKIVAILHDVVENTDITFDDLINEGIPKHLVITLRLLTRSENMSYEDYIARIAENPLAVKVKLADMKDNMDLTRIKEINEEDIERFKKYVDNYKFLKSRLS
ncbi:GTP pyrophosphokinase [Dysgonomonas sp. OttesenSCG-928-M03]|nr:GTP pyrophosphokinase [Dysgonomonas sp. OttesenSCG-928-M03]